MSLIKNLNNNNSPAVFISCPHKYIIDSHEITVGQDEEKEMPPLAPLLLLGKLKHHNLPCDFLDWSSFSNHDINEIAFIASQYSIIFTSANSINWGIVNTLAKKIKQHNHKCKICVGGPHPSLYYQSISKKDHFDFIVSGKADDEIVSIYTKIIDTSHSNIAQKTTIIPPITDLNKLDNYISYDLIPSNLYKSIPLETSRGCKYDCSFCSILSHKNWRSYNTKKTIKQFETAFKFMGKKSCNTIQIVDNSFTSDNKRAIEICSHLSFDKFGNTLSYDATIADLQNKELISNLSSFTKHLLAGAEITTSTLAKRIKKPVTPNSIKKAAQNLYEFNISHKAVFSFIIGFGYQRKTGQPVNSIS